MYWIWRDVREYRRPAVCGFAGGGGDGEFAIIDGLLRLVLEHGHSKLRPDDAPSEVIEAMTLIRETLNSDHDQWPETHGMTEAEWAEMFAEGDRVRAAKAAAAAAQAEA